VNFSNSKHQDFHQGGRDPPRKAASVRREEVVLSRLGESLEFFALHLSAHFEVKSQSLSPRSKRYSHSRIRALSDARVRRSRHATTWPITFSAAAATFFGARKRRA
jgi:hypothetical protein